MSAPITIRMTLTGPHKGKTKLFGKYQFNKGICYFTGNEQEAESVAKYFTRSYQVKVEVVTEEPVVEELVVEEPKGLKDDDSDVFPDEPEQDEDEDGPEEPNARQAEIIAAVNCIDKEEWVDLNAQTPRPKVKDVQTRMEDPTVTKNEIVEVIETWLS